MSVKIWGGKNRFYCEKNNRNEHEQGKEQAPDIGYEAEVILFDDLDGGEFGLDEIIGLFAAVDRHGHHREQEHAKHESDQEFLQYVPVQFLHEVAKSTGFFRNGPGGPVIVLF